MFDDSVAGDALFKMPRGCEGFRQFGFAADQNVVHESIDKATQTVSAAKSIDHDLEPSGVLPRVTAAYPAIQAASV